MVEVPKEPMISYVVPSLPWMKIGVDLFNLDKKDYIVAVDYYSNYPEVATLSGTRTTAIVQFLASQFARHGIPQEVVTGNGPQFTSDEFKQSSEKWGFTHTTVLHITTSRMEKRKTP